MGLDHHIILEDIKKENIDRAFKVYAWLYKEDEEEHEFIKWLHKEILFHLKEAEELLSEKWYLNKSITVWFKHNEPDALKEYMFDLLSTIMLFEDLNSIIIFKFNDGYEEKMYYFIKGKYFDENGNVYKVNKKKLLRNIINYKKSVYKEKLERLEKLSKKLEK